MTLPESTLVPLQAALLVAGLLVAVGGQLLLRAWWLPLVSLGANIAVGGSILLVLSPPGAARLGPGGQVAFLVGYGVLLLAACGLTYYQYRHKPPGRHTPQ